MPTLFDSTGRTRPLVLSLSLSIAVFIAGCGGKSASLTGSGSSNVQKTLVGVAVSPATASIMTGATQQFRTMANYSDSSTTDVSSLASWTAASTNVATIDASGKATGVAPGTTLVTALYNGSSATATLTVMAPTVKSIAISPGNADITAGATQQFTATASYSNGTTANVTSGVIWTSSNAAVASITPAGLATGIAAGSSTLTASLGGVVATAALTVAAGVPSSVVSIAISPGSGDLVAGITQQFTATATYSNGTTGNVTPMAGWRSSNTAVATITPAGLVTAVAAGSTTLTATDNGANAAVVLTVEAPSVTSIALSPNGPDVMVGSTEQLTATATYNNGTSTNVTSAVTWKSSNTAVATITPAGLVTGVAAGSTTLTASLNGVNGTESLTVTTQASTITSIAVSPSAASFAVNATQQFAATATYADGHTASVTSQAAWTASNTYVATINSAGLATAVASGTTTVTASLNGVSGTDAISVTIAPGTAVNVATWHFDNNRSGLNAGEQSLTPANVTPQTFGKLFSYLVDGYAYAEPLLVSNVTINGSVHNVLYVATEHDSVYAFDADNYGSGAPLWQVSLLQSGESPLTDDPDLQPYDGVTSTPVIDLTSNTMYVVSKQMKPGSAATFRLSALDITTGAQKFGGPVTVTASVAGTNPQAGNGTTVSLVTECIQRSALLLANGNVYIGFGSCPTGWLLAYNDKTLAQVGVFNASPNVPDASDIEFGSAGGIWMGSGGPAEDSAGNVYVATGNGPWDGVTAWGDSVLKFDPLLTKVQDYFTPDNYQYMDCNDADLDSGGVMLVPGTTPTQLLVGGKTGKLYLLNTSNLGKEQANDVGATQSFFFEPDVIPSYPQSCTDTSGTYTTDINSYEDWGIAAYFNGAVYLGVSPTSLVAQVNPGTREFTVSGNTLTMGTLATPNIQQYAPGTTPFMSANGTANGIMWMIDEGVPIQSQAPNAGAATNATLRAYDAANLTNELYNSSANSDDVPGLGIKFSSPIVANGKAYISTGHDPVTVANPRGEIDVYGLH